MQPVPALASESSPAAVRAKFWVVFLNATACYLIAYQLVALVYQAGTAFMARRQGVPGTWGLGGVQFELGDSGWHQSMVLAVYGTGPALALGLGVLAFVVFWKQQRHRRGLGKLLLLWLVLHAVSAAFGGLLADTVTQSGSWYVPNWLLGNGSTWPSTVLGLLLAAVQLVLGYLAALPFLLTQDSHTVLQFERRAQLVRYTIFGPWLAGSALLALSKLPYLSLNECLRYVALLLLLLPLALGCLQETFNQKKWTPSPTRVAWGLLGLAGLGLAAWRLALAGGVRV